MNLRPCLGGAANRPLVWGPESGRTACRIPWLHGATSFALQMEKAQVPVSRTAGWALVRFLVGEAEGCVQ